MMKKCFIALLIVLFCADAIAQKPFLQFEKDSIALGHPFKTSLSFRHASNADVFFPDSNFVFAGFDLVAMEYFPTKTTDSISLDSVVYTLKSFEVKNTQYLQLPVWLYLNGDSTQILSNKDSVFFKSQINDSNLAIEPYLRFEDFMPLSKEFNYPALLRNLSFLIIIGLIIYFLFGKTIKNYLARYRFNRKHKIFTQKFKTLLRSDYATKNLNDAVILWKNHMEWLDQKPYTSMSTSEIKEVSNHENLAGALKEIDKAVYGGIAEGNLSLALQILYNNANEAFRKKKRILYRKQQNKKWKIR